MGTDRHDRHRHCKLCTLEKHLHTAFARMSSASSKRRALFAEQMQMLWVSLNSRHLFADPEDPLRVTNQTRDLGLIVRTASSLAVPRLVDAATLSIRLEGIPCGTFSP